MTLGFLSEITVVIGGSLAAYFKFGHHRPVVLLVGAIAVILVLMEAAYRRWAEADTTLTESITLLVEQLRQGNEILAEWPNPNLLLARDLPPGKPALLADAENTLRVDPWEEATYIALRRFAPGHSGHFFLDVNLGPEWFQEYSDERPERAKLRRRLHRLDEIITDLLHHR
jgi:hypothetical protein